MKGRLSYFSLFTSFATLLCCALPSLLVLLGLGATLASFLSATPWLVALSRHKNVVFAISGALIAGNFLYVFVLAPKLRGPALACAANDPQGCETADKMSRLVLWISGVIYLVGFFSAYALGPLLMRFG